MKSYESMLVRKLSLAQNLNWLKLFKIDQISFVNDMASQTLTKSWKMHTLDLKLYGSDGIISMCNFVL
jgi:hypothetical protein